MNLSINNSTNLPIAFNFFSSIWIKGLSIDVWYKYRLFIFRQFEIIGLIIKLVKSTWPCTAIIFKPRHLSASKIIETSVTLLPFTNTSILAFTLILKHSKLRHRDDIILIHSLSTLAQWLLDKSIIL